MPCLKDLQCSIELSDSQQTLQEFGTSYGDAFVETFVPVPSKPESFSIHLTSDKFIAPGIAMYVFIDGVYQCNRNRQDLKLRKSSKSRSLVDFRVRQKEEKQKDGSMIAREWKFEKLNIVSADEAPHECSSDLLANIGCIEVVVLRCAGPRNAKTVSPMNMDGANDVADHMFGFDGPSQETPSDSIYDDRLPFSSGRRKHSGPPPPLHAYQSPYAETVQSHAPTHSHRSQRSFNASIHPSHQGSQAQLRHGGTSGPGAHGANKTPLFGVQYGSGPLPPVGEPFYHNAPSGAIANVPIIDPQWLDKLVTKAVKKRVEESHRDMAPSRSNAMQSQNIHGTDVSSRTPGAWPTSPNEVVIQPEKVFQSDLPIEEHNTTRTLSQGGWVQRPSQSKAGTKVTWSDAGPAWDSTASADGWNTNEDTATESWDTDETFEKKESSRWKEDDRKARSRSTRSRSRRTSRAVSPLTIRIKSQSQSKDGFSVRLRSKSRSRRFRADEDIPSSSEDKDGWTHDETTSSAAEDSSDDTIQPSHSQSQVHTIRSRSKARSRGSKSTRNVKRRPSEHWDAIQDWQTQLNNEPASSVQKTVTPQTMDFSTSINTGDFHGAPLNVDFVPSPLPPAPYAPTVPDLAIHKGYTKPFETQSAVSSIWSGEPRGKQANDFWEAVPGKETGWESIGTDGWDTTDTDKKVEHGWQTTAEKPKSTSYAKKSAWAGDSNAKNNEWGTDLRADDQIRKSGSLASWNTKKSGWEATEIASLLPFQQKKFSWDHLDAEDSKKTGLQEQKTVISWTTVGPAQDKQDKAIQKATSTSQRHSNKSLSKYRQLRSASDIGPKQHWQFPPPPPEKKLHHISEHNHGSYIAPEEPLLKIPKEFASEKGIEHQVRAGKGIQYGHVVGRPEYLDTLDKPYAVFRFKYRSRSTLRSLFGKTLIPPHGPLTLPTRGSALADAKHKLKNIPQDELIDKMLKLQETLAEKGYTRDDREKKEKQKRREKERRPSVSAATEVAARGFTEKWVEMQSRETSLKGKKEKSEKSEKKREKERQGKKVEGWGETKNAEIWEGVKW
ncbi:hypothetical protein IAQ61_004115 [Plenodomus lingam]|uniref:Predicted protein n=1 Tax=Leptosphaeria maculans (strain JN3 / isolate v23.1.3 / race Av1-4-5-6-7-8) TaxID=985895 RepID=E4ZX84_LEPMJ|nr:predicted protein [Plenodomus lingam JN3]KAH9873492.1 hypothetical protein IAQ61_004115 [Plenodomus lingam]CBX95294.1 predicted protein [Plenodomus lingam JN3]